MFKKPFNVKSQIQLKSSEKKKLGLDIKTAFPAMTAEDIQFFANCKENIMRMKLLTFNEEHVEVYIVDKVPMFFDVVDLGKKYPTVYMCWKFPHIVTPFTTSKMVLDKLKGGADLFLPGVYLDTKAIEENVFERGDPVSVNLETNAAVFAVGECLKSKKDIHSTETAFMGGKVVKVYHCVGDHLSKLHSVPMPQLGRPAFMSDIPEPIDEVLPSSEPEAIEETVDVIVTPEPCEEAPAPEMTEPPPTDEASEKEKMTELLEYCFLKALKFSPKTIYPILPATFYANHMLTGLPAGESLNVKKTKWKKLSVFLQEKAADGIVKLESAQKNEFRILGVETSHPVVRQFVDIHNTEPITVTPKATGVGQPSVQQVYAVSAATLPFFAKEGFKKSDELTRNDVRNHLNEYVKREGLQDPAAQDRVRLDPVLYGVLKTEVMTRGDLVTALLDRMSLQHKVSAGEENVIVHKGKMPMVEFEVFTRSGNKKVTLISNLESYGVDIAAFAKELQHVAAASTTVSGYVPGKKGPQVQVQGNQILQAAKLLDEKHGIKDKFMRGLEKAPKSRKK